MTRRAQAVVLAAILAAAAALLPLVAFAEGLAPRPAPGAPIPTTYGAPCPRGGASC